MTSNSNTPIMDALIHHNQCGWNAMHVPGHQQGRLLPGRFSVWLGAAAKLDLTEIPGLDNLHAPTGCIADSERLTADYYGARQTWYSVNGSTAGVMAALLAAVGETQEVLFLNPFHQSAWQGLVLSGAIPVTVPYTFSCESWTSTFPSVAAVEQALNQHPNVRAVFVTSPTYQGLVGPVSDYVRLCHARNIPVIVDEAHGAHFGVHPNLPSHSIAAGADVVVQSVHKMLPALTQTAWVHCQGDLLNAERVGTWLRFVQSTSPSYLLMASIDVASAWLREDGEATVSQSLAVLAAMHRQREGGELRGMLRDPYKTWIPTANQSESNRLVAVLRRHRLVPEYADAFGVLSVWRLDVKEPELTTFWQAVDEWRTGSGSTTPTILPIVDALIQCQLTETALSPRAANGLPVRSVKLRESVGEVLGSLLTPYPPGVPVGFPGQIITKPFAEAIAACLNDGMAIHGINQEDYVSVLDTTRRT